MPIQKSKLIQILSKFTSNSSAACLHCNKLLEVTGIAENPRHLYTIGQMFSCPCHKSKIWTNSIRNVSQLVAYWDGKIKYPISGFCNDRFCGFTFEPLKVLKNGIEVPGYTESADLIGNPKHPSNQMAYWFFQEDPEGTSTTLKLAKWYEPFRKDILGMLK